MYRKDLHASLSVGALPAVLTISLPCLCFKAFAFGMLRYKVMHNNVFSTALTLMLSCLSSFSNRDTYIHYLFSLSVFLFHPGLNFKGGR